MALFYIYCIRVQDKTKSPYNLCNPGFQSDTTIIHTPETQTTKQTMKDILIVGGGLAGCLTACTLLQQGFNLTLIEKRHALAQSASGMSQIALDIKLSSDCNIYSQFYLAAYQFAQHFYNQALYKPYWHQTGLLQLAWQQSEQQRQQKFYTAQQPEPDLCYPVNTRQASQLVGTELSAPALYFPHGGFLQAQQLCHHLGQHIRKTGQLILGCELAELVQEKLQPCWLAIDKQGNTIGRFHAVVLCNAYWTKQSTYTDFLPLKAIKGQATAIKANRESPDLQCILSNPGNIFPSYHGKLWLGASYEMHNLTENLDKNTLRNNISKWSAIAPPLFQHYLKQYENNQFTGRAAVRCTTPDYMPVLGQVPVVSDYIHDFALLRKNARARINKPVSYHAGLYINTGHGSRGCCSIPLCAQLIADMIMGKPLPLSDALLPYLYAERFLAKSLIQGAL